MVRLNRAELARPGATTVAERQMVRRRLVAGISFVLILLVSIVGLEPFQNLNMTDAAAQGDLGRQILMSAVLGLLFLGPLGTAAVRKPMAVPFSLVLMLGYCLLTAYWAIDPLVSLRRLVLTSMVVWMLVRCIGDLGAVRSLNVIRGVLIAILVVNYLMVWQSPYGVHMATVDEAVDVIGDWRGILPHKNVAGAVCAITILIFSFDATRIPLWLNAAVIGATSFFLAMTASKTSMAVLVIAIGAGFLMLRYNPRHRSLVWPMALVALAGLMGLAAMYSGAIERILNDPNALSGRSAIWPLLVDYAQEHFWTGAGYASFWQIGEASPIWNLTTGWVAKYASHGHNGYLDLLVTIGFPGLVLAVAVLLVWPALRLLFSYDISRQRRALLISVIVFCAGHNMSESSILDRASIVNVFLMIAVIMTHRLSNQSVGRHHRMRARMAQAAGARQLARLVGRMRQTAVLAPRRQAGREDGLA